MIGGQIRAARSVAALAVAGVLLTSCSSTASTESTGSTQSSAVSLSDGWAKAATPDGMGMTALFGTLSNASTAEAHLVSMSCGDVAGMVELHETVTDASGNPQMRKTEAGFTVPAGGSLQLAPGGNHVMLMGLTKALNPGDELTCTASFADASTLSFTVPVKEFSGANESYSGGTATATPATMG